MPGLSSVTVASLAPAELQGRLKREGIFLRLPPFVFKIHSSIPIVAQGIAELYADYELLADDTEFADFHVAVNPGRQLPRPLCVFELDGVRPFTPLAMGEAFAFLEWGMNWCVTGYCHTQLTLHAAVLERRGRVLLMPAPPGSGKSTLCAALMLDGWRLLSDEMALLDPVTGLVTPAPRPVSLKNGSIEIIRRRAPNASWGPTAHDTLKGTVAHLRASSASVARAGEPGLPGWVVFPKYRADATAQLLLRPKAASLMQLAQNSFNQHVLGKAGFDALAEVIERSDCYDFSYAQLDEALPLFAALPLPS